MRLNFNFGFGERKKSGGAPPSVVNLLLWSEGLDQASAWVPTNMLVTADVDGTGDELDSTSVGSALRQVSGAVATIGAAVTASLTPHPSTPVRGSVTGTFDGLPYTFSIEGRDTGGGEVYTLRLDRSGGFLRASIEEPLGTGTAIFFRAQLEQAAAFTTYQFRGGS